MGCAKGCLRQVFLAWSVLFSILAIAQDKPAPDPVAKPAPKPGAESQKPAAVYVSDDDVLTGDRLRLWTNVTGFKPVGEPNATPRCATKDSTLIVKAERNGELTVFFYSLAENEEPLIGKKAWRDAVDACKANPVNGYTTYTISRTELENAAAYRRTGMSFGGLVVPFKYRLGGDKKITASSTVAPYLGFRTGLGQRWGATFTPVVSAGLGLVPITDPATNQTETKNALSLSFGMVINTSKNQKFNAGILFGWDFLSEADQARDPNVEKPWLSFYVGTNF